MSPPKNRLRALLRERRLREPAIAAVLVLGFLLVRTGEWMFAPDGPVAGAQDGRAQAHEALNAAVHEFSSVQRSARRIAVEVGQRSAVLQFLSGIENDRARLFEVTDHIAELYEVGVEIYDLQGELIAWAGPGGGGNNRREIRIALDGQMISYVVRTPIASQLFVATPVRRDGRILGVVVIRQTIETRYPFSNRYIDRSGLSERLSNKLGVQVEFEFTPSSAWNKDARWSSAPLIGIDSTRVGMVRVSRADTNVSAEKISALLASIQVLLLGLLALVILIPVVRWCLSLHNAFVACLGITGAVWLLRYTLLWMGFPSQVFALGIFDPLLFASKFGGGLARSIGEMSLTVTALSVNFLLVLLRLDREPPRKTADPAASALPFRVAVAASVMMILFGLLRGVHAVVRSAAFDSILNIGDPGVIMPGVDLMLMLVNLLMLGILWVAVALRATRSLVRMLGGGATAYGIVTVSALAAAWFYLAFPDEPLMSTGYTVIVALALPALTRWVREGRWAVVWPLNLRGWMSVAALATLALLPPIADQVRERDRSRVETYAAEVLRPVDGWLKFIVEEGLTQMARPEIVGALDAADEESRAGAAIAAWARSAACREGYTSVFEVVDSAGGSVSRFAIGAQTALASQVGATLPLDSAGAVRVKSIGDGVSAVRIYGGSAQLPTGSHGVRTFGRVVVAAGEQQLFRGDAPPILRGATREPLESFYRPISISEYRDGLLLRSTNDRLPFNHTLADTVRPMLARRSPPMAWTEERIAGIDYEAFHVLTGAEGRDVIVLAMERPGVLLTVVGLVKVPVTYAVLILLGFIVWLIWAWLRGRRLALTFRDRLLTAMLITALVPLGVLLVYGHYEVQNRVMEGNSRRLEAETGGIALDVAGIGEHADASSEFSLRPERVELIASNAGTDFNFYVGNELRISSRPELYAAGLLDTRMNGNAYAAVVLGGQRFHMQTEHIGLFRYVVGYRPVLDAAGGVIGVVSVPTLYRQDELERELYGRNAVLFGIYAVVLGLILVLTTILANRIAAPIQRLTDLTRDVAAGDLEISARIPNAEGEIGELVRAFESMTRDLRARGNELIRVERELAWKEMARQVAHEIKNPLTPMKLSIQHLRQTYRDGAPAFSEILEQVTRTIIEQIDTLSRIASEFSHFARMPRRVLETCDVAELVASAVQLMNQEAGVVFEIRADPVLPSITADREELRRACVNILRNGVQAMNGRGLFVISIRRGDGTVRLAFQDSGTGIPEEIKAKLFQPNFSTKTDGMGLGLAIVKKTIDDMGGKVWIESEEGKGTTVFLEIPAV